jgi:hypothetical protein
MMKLSPLVFGLAVAWAHAAAAKPMDALQDYVGTWTCVERQATNPPVSSTFTVAMQGNLMREWIARPRQGSMRSAYFANATFAYDAPHHRYVETEMDTDAHWYVSVADPWTGDTIKWVDVATSEQPSHWEMKRINRGNFTVSSFARLADHTPNYTANCKRVDK